MVSKGPGCAQDGKFRPFLREAATGVGSPPRAMGTPSGSLALALLLESQSS